MTDGQTNERTFAIVESLSRLKKIFGRENNVDCHLFRVQLSTISKM